MRAVRKNVCCKMSRRFSRNRRHPAVTPEAYDCMWKHGGEKIRFLSCVDKDLFIFIKLLCTYGRKIFGPGRQIGDFL